MFISTPIYEIETYFEQSLYFEQINKMKFYIENCCFLPKKDIPGRWRITSWITSKHCMCQRLTSNNNFGDLQNFFQDIVLPRITITQCSFQFV